MSRRIAQKLSCLSIALAPAAVPAFALPADVGRTADVLTNAVRYQAAIQPAALQPAVLRPRARPEVTLAAAQAPWTPNAFDAAPFAKTDATFAVALAPIDLGERWISPFTDDDLFQVGIEIAPADPAAVTIAWNAGANPYWPLGTDLVTDEARAAMAQSDTTPVAPVVAVSAPALEVAQSPVPYVAVQASAARPPYVAVEAGGAVPTHYVAVEAASVPSEAAFVATTALSTAAAPDTAPIGVYTPVAAPTPFVAVNLGPVPYVAVEAGGITPTPYVPLEGGDVTPAAPVAFADAVDYAPVQTPTPFVPVSLAIDGGALASATSSRGADDSDLMAAMTEADDNLVMRDGGDDGVDTMMMSSDVLFSFGKAELAPEAFETLASIGKMADDVPVLQVFGHTDAIGREADNLALGQRRAETVRAWLLANTSFTEDRIIATGIGEIDPVAANVTVAGQDNPDGRAQNRRVEFAFHDAGYPPEG